MSGETRKLTTILAADVVGYSRLAAADEERTLARLRALRSDLVDPAISIHHGRVVKRTGDGILVEFRSPVEAVRCAIEVQDGMAERNAGLPPEKRIAFRVGIHLGDVVEEVDGDLMGDGVNIAARLEGIAEPGGVNLSRAAYEQVDGKVGQRFADLGSKELKNIPRPVHVFAIERDRKEQGASQTPASAPRLSIVVLPFANIGGEPEHEYFVDGVTESLTTDLSRISGSFVIGRSTAFTFKDKAVDLKQIGRDLNVRYVLEGSVQRGGNRIRVNVQLVDAESGNHLWAERFDKPLADLFDMQDEIVSRLANALNAHLIAAEARRAERVSNPDSLDLYFQGMAWLNKGWTPEYLERALRFFDDALALDPTNVPALVGSATAKSVFGGTLYGVDRDTRFAEAEASVTKALSLAPEYPMAHAFLGWLQIMTNRATRGIVQSERALALDRNLAFAHGAIGLAYFLNGRCAEVEARINEALRLSPRDVNAYVWMSYAGCAKAYLGANEEAVSWFRRGIDTNRNFPSAHFWLAAALANLDRLDEARAEVAAGLVLDSAFTVTRFRNGAVSDHPTFLAQREQFVVGMRKAGVPEGGEPELPVAPRLSIVVLPFANISGDPDQEYFVDGLTEDLTTELSRLAGAFVIARNTAFTYKGKPYDIRQIGRELGVRYALEGSIRRSGARVRVNAQLIDAASGAHLWADRFDRDAGDLFDLQDALTIELANVLGAQLIEVEGLKSRISTVPGISDLVMQARAAVNRGPQPENYDAALGFYEQALQRDPRSIPARAGLATLLAVKVVFLMSKLPSADMARAEGLAADVLREKPNDLGSHFSMGLLRRMQNRFDEARNHMEAVIRINPSSRLGHSELGWLHTVCGRADEALPYFEKSRRLSLRDPYLFLDHGGIGWVYFVRRDYARAVEHLLKSLSLYPSWVWSNVTLIAACVEAGRLDDARRYLRAYLHTQPSAGTIALMRANAVSHHPDYMPQIERVYEGLRLAGMPDE